jgi:uncharacterized protein YndB with AHSA1/START domain
VGAENQIEIDASRERVFEVLSDAGLYAEWVVGAVEVRDSDATWPAPGSRMHHSTGVGPATIDDTTEVLACEPPGRLVLLAHVGPLGDFQVELLLADRGGGRTHVRMLEEPVAGVSVHAGVIGDAAGALRNKLSLTRLKSLAERDAA